MKTATLVKLLPGKSAMLATSLNQGLYHLSDPLDGYSDVVVSAANTVDHGPETYIFGATPEGRITNWSELSGSFVGDMDHAKALGNAGYTIMEAK